MPGSPVRLSDFAGRIVFFDFFDPTCGDCQFASGESVDGIQRWYAAKNGSSNGLPVSYLSINLVPQDFLQKEVDDFINELGLESVVNDYNTNSTVGALQTNAVHDLFQAPFFRPVILIVNGVSNSPTYSQWSLILNEGGGVADWDVAKAQWQALIDGVQAPPPQLTNLGMAAGKLQFMFPGQRGRTNQVQTTTDWINWTVLTNAYGTNGPILCRDTNSPGGGRFFRVKRL